MSIVTISSVDVKDNPAPFTAPLKFEICYESLEALEEDLEWKLVYVGSAEDESCDQVLESVFVGPVVPGVFRFLLEADPPQPEKIPKQDILGATVIFLSCCYRDQEFIRVGYYVSNEVPGQEELAVAGEAPAEKPADEVVAPPADLSQVSRNICSIEPRVTKFPIKWDNLKGLPRLELTEEKQAEHQLLEQQQHQEQQQQEGQQGQQELQIDQPESQMMSFGADVAHATEVS